MARRTRFQRPVVVYEGPFRFRCIQRRQSGSVEAQMSYSVLQLLPGREYNGSASTSATPRLPPPQRRPATPNRGTASTLPAKLPACLLHCILPRTSPIARPALLQYISLCSRLSSPTTPLWDDLQERPVWLQDHWSCSRRYVCSRPPRRRACCNSSMCR
jgi:hypothetical protein